MSKIGQALEKAAKERLTIMKEKPVVAESCGKTGDSKMDPHIITYFDSTSPIAEQYRTLRTNIQSISQTKPPKTLLITSAVNGEGKTVTAINLAIAMAHDPHKKVLLCDCDLRRGRVGQFMGLDHTHGLSDSLNNGINLTTTLLNTDIENLKVLISGSPCSNPSELLGSWRMKELLQSLKSQFDYLILDAPPVTLLTDAAVLSSQVDGVLFVVKTAKTQRETVQHAESLLLQAKANILGYILTGLENYVPEYIQRYF